MQGVKNIALFASSMKALLGAAGRDVVIKVPAGVTVKTDEEQIIGMSHQLIYPTP